MARACVRARVNTHVRRQSFGTAHLSCQILRRISFRGRTVLGGPRQTGARRSAVGSSYGELGWFATGALPDSRQC